jgi:hypothetical protein
MRPAHALKGSRLAARERQILAAAFEVSEEQVEEDLRQMMTWSESPDALTAWFQQRHGWDPSVPPYYVASLRRARERPLTRSAARRVMVSPRHQVFGRLYRSAGTATASRNYH